MSYEDDEIKDVDNLEDDGLDDAFLDEEIPLVDDEEEIDSFKPLDDEEEEDGMPEGFADLDGSEY